MFSRSDVIGWLFGSSNIAIIRLGDDYLLVDWAHGDKRMLIKA